MKSGRGSKPASGAFSVAVRFLVVGFSTFSSVSVQAQSVPHIDILQPISARPGDPDFTLTIFGAGLVDGTALNFDGQVYAAACNPEATQCSATVPAESIATTHTASVRAVGPGGASNVVLFPVTYPTPSVHTLGGPPLAAQRTDLPLRGSFAVADFDNDGRLDVAVNREDVSELNILLGDGMGGFEAAPPQPQAPGLLTGTVGDFNGDGDVDLVALSRGSQTVTVLLGDGAGGFSAIPSSAVGDAPWSAAAGDFNGDGNLDLAVTINGDDVLTILLGDGTGDFSALLPVVTGDNPDSLAAGDFNRDGYLDLVVIGNPITVWLGDGAGNFASTSLSHSITGSVVAGDFNGDAKLDVAVANRLSKSNSVTILRGNGMGAFSLFPQSFPAGSLPTDLSVGDFNGDGKLDLATVSIENDFGPTSVGCLSHGLTGVSFAGRLTVLMSDGVGGFSRRTLADSTGACPLAIAAGDFNGDGRIDFMGQYAGLPFNPEGFLSLYSQRLYPIAVPSPASVAFGDHVAGIASAPRLLTLTNHGTVPLHVADVTVESAVHAPFSFSAPHDCFTSSPLAPGESCTTQITFTPPGQSTIPFTGRVTFTSDSGLFGGNQQDVNLSGRGQGLPLSLSPETLNFGEPSVNTTSPPLIAMVTNAQTVPLLVDQIALFQFNAETGEPLTAPGVFAFAPGTTCPLNGGALEPSASCALAATFTPTAAGNFFASAAISLNGIANLQRVTLLGRATVDTTPPTITPVVSGPLGANGWYIGDVTLTWDVQDNESAITSTSGCDSVSVTSDTTGVTFTCTATSAGGTASESVATKLDKTPPSVVCGAPDGLWHNADVAIGCTATGEISGLANAADAAFNLMTSVSANTEDANAATNSRTVYDNAGNSTTAGPVGGNRVDKKAPAIEIAAPAATTYLVNQPVASNYACADAGSGLASCAGPVPSGANFSTAVPGANSFAVDAFDNVSNASHATLNYQVQYQTAGTLCNGAPGHQILEPIKADGSSVFRRQSTVPARFRVCDVHGVSIGTPGVVSSFNVIQIISGTVSSDVNETVLSTTPDSAFRWDSTDRQWIFNVSNKNLEANATYVFRISLNDGTHIDFQYGLK